jgi:hypothetical protein
MAAVITFEDFKPGTVIGSATVQFEEGLAERWRAIFLPGSSAPGAGGGALGAGIAVAMMMRGYLDVVRPRPPGNVHARQQFNIARLPKRGESVTTVVSCASKELRRDRRYVELDVRGFDDAQRPVYDGRMTLIWAA